MRRKLRGRIAQAPKINYSLHALLLSSLGTMTGTGQILLFKISPAPDAVNQVVHRGHAFHRWKQCFGTQHIALDALDLWAPRLLLKIRRPAPPNSEHDTLSAAGAGQAFLRRTR